MRATSDFPKSEAVAFATAVFPDPVPPATPIKMAYLSSIQKEKVKVLNSF